MTTMTDLRNYVSNNWGDWIDNSEPVGGTEAACERMAQALWDAPDYGEYLTEAEVMVLATAAVAGGGTATPGEG